MTDYATLSTRFQENALQLVREWVRSQERAIEAVRETRSRVADQLPAPTEVLESNYAFMTQVLEAQKEATIHWIEALQAPVPAARRAAGKAA